MTTFCGPIQFTSIEQINDFCVFDAVAACESEDGRDIVGFYQKKPVYAQYGSYEWIDDGELVSQVVMTAHL